ncbi:hypothetical protein SEVIR_1G144900v4 [Setaria viridis]|uniref:Uncharacterized protein n=2 Tax=Setaria TaxID=4554 RepID=K3YWT1_SETIT|nr:protein FON2 SPARE1 [Setaria italica]XP_034600359.1 protein FON2 SPARE1-like [Setaria viridis]RCV06221.1 hypothetical protein SETIT_1G146100v2 [Setaria italica]TKW38900.1 hypothetical protein SEVIR_1G144900v2 [Setaria viridis]
MRQPTTAVSVILLWLALLTVAFHGCGGLLVRRTVSVAIPARKMLLAVTSFDAAASSSTGHHHHQNQQRQHHQHHQHHHHHVDRWNRQGIPPSSVGKGEEIDPRYGVQKRLVPTGPNPLHH